MSGSRETEFPLPSQIPLYNPTEYTREAYEEGSLPLTGYKANFLPPYFPAILYGNRVYLLDVVPGLGGGPPQAMYVFCGVVDDPNWSVKGDLLVYTYFNKSVVKFPFRAVEAKTSTMKDFALSGNPDQEGYTQLLRGPYGFRVKGSFAGVQRYYLIQSKDITNIMYDNQPIDVDFTVQPFYTGETPETSSHPPVRSPVIMTRRQLHNVTIARPTARGGFYPSVYGGIAGAGLFAPLAARQAYTLWNARGRKSRGRTRGQAASRRTPQTRKSNRTSKRS